MSLSEIKNKLYKKEADKNLYQHDANEFDIRTSPAEANPSAEKFSADSGNEWNGADERSGKRKKIIKFSLIAGSVVLILVVFLLAFLKFKQMSFDAGRVTVAIQGKEDPKSGKLAVYEITYRNNNRAKLQNAVLRLSYPENFRPEENPNFKEEGLTVGSYYLGDILGNAEGKIAFNGRAYGLSENLLYLKAELAFTPSTISTAFVSKTQYGINVISTPIKLEILAPQNAATGDAVEYLVSYQNIGNEDFEGIRLKIDYPEGFTYSKSDPAPSEGSNVWYVGSLLTGQAGKISVSGKIEGDNLSIKTAKAHIGIINQGEFMSYTEEKTETKVSRPPLTIIQVVNGKEKLEANAGEILNYEIAFKNDMNLDLRDLIVTESLDSPILNYDTLKLERGGYFDMDKKIITWKASDNPKLAMLKAGEAGLIKFSIRIKDIVPINSPVDKNFAISSVAKIDSPDIPTPLEENKIISGNRLDIKLNSKIILESFGVFNTEAMVNSGPMPPVVGQETTYSIFWRLTNVSNDIADAKVSAVLPTNVVMIGKTVPENSGIEFNDRNNTVSWNIGDVSAGTGIISPAQEIIFQVKLTPLPSQVDNAAQLVGPATFSAKDLFTNQNLEVSVKEKTTNLPEDKSIQYGYKVRASQ